MPRGSQSGCGSPRHRRAGPATPPPAPARRTPPRSAPRRPATAAALARTPREARSPAGRGAAPASVDTPSTSRTLPRIDPTSEAFTTSCNPAPSANNAIQLGSVVEVTLRNLPIPGPTGRPTPPRSPAPSTPRSGSPPAPGPGTPTSPRHGPALQHHRHRDQRHQQARPARRCAGRPTVDRSTGGAPAPTTKWLPRREPEPAERDHRCAPPHAEPPSPPVASSAPPSRPWSRRPR